MDMIGMERSIYEAVFYDKGGKHMYWGKDKLLQ